MSTKLLGTLGSLTGKMQALMEAVNRANRAISGRLRTPITVSF